MDAMMDYLLPPIVGKMFAIAFQSVETDVPIQAKVSLVVTSHLNPILIPGSGRMRYAQLHKL
jgi:hypothetical protein